MVSTPIRAHPVTRQKLISVTPSVSLAPQLYLIPNHTHPVWTNLLFHSCCHISGVLNPAVYICHGNCNNGLSHCISCKKLLNGNTVMLITFRMFIRHKFIVTETKRFTCGSTWTLKVAKVCCAFITLNDHLVEELGFKKQLFFFCFIPALLRGLPVLFLPGKKKQCVKTGASVLWHWQETASGSTAKTIELLNNNVVSNDQQGEEPLVWKGSLTF